mgnify:CR=1 FL=1
MSCKTLSNSHILKWLKPKNVLHSSVPTCTQILRRLQSLGNGSGFAGHFLSRTQSWIILSELPSRGKKINPLTHPISSPPMGWSLTGTRTTHEHNNAILTPKIPMRLRIDFDIKRLLLVQVPSQTDTGIKSSLYYLAYIFLLLRQNNS